MIDIKKIQAAVGAMDQVTVKGGKLYTQVAQRVEAFRNHIGDELGMESEIVCDDGKRVVMKATIKSRDGFVVATGWAEELRGGTGVNKMACIENTETSAYGRALANLGIHGGEFASDNEIDKARRNEKIIDEAEQAAKEAYGNVRMESTPAQPPPANADVSTPEGSWAAWVENQKKIIDSHDSLGALNAWANQTAKPRADLESNFPEIYDPLRNYFNAKYDKLNEELGNG
jgi:hypothetical protein|tara:strand:- start:275 stop:964 length:690 start_codon:yes stop_codon:yes gene_type:complete